MPRLSELLLDHARSKPELPYVNDLRHGDLLAASARYAHALTTSGLKPGDRCAFEATKSVHTVLAYLGCLRAGVVFAPLNPGNTHDETVAAVEAVQASLYVGVTAAGVRHLTPQALQELAECSATSFDDVATRPDDTVAMLFSSGTTGRPKGVPLTNRNLVSNAWALTDAWEISSTDVLLHVLPLFHTHGLFVAINCVLSAGASMVLHEGFNPREAVSALSGCTLFMGVPTHYNRMLNEPQLTPEHCRGVRLFVSGSAPMSADMHATFLERTGQPILERYGMTETSILCSNPLRGPRKPGSVGPAVRGVAVRISGSGEIEVRGDNVFNGYWDTGTTISSPFTDDGWFRTGDLGTIDPDGYLTILGRSKDLIISGGFNVYPREVEELLAMHEAVVECAVVGLPDPDLGERVVAVVVLRDGSDATPATVHRWAREHLADYKAPRTVVQHPGLPRNALGKVEKVRLRASLVADL